MKTATIDLQKFCSQGGEWNSNKTGKPWTRGEWTYATNGHLIVRLPAVFEIPDRQEAPNASSLQWNSVVSEDQWLKIDEIKLDMVNCEECDGGEKNPHDCPTCTCECDYCFDGKVFKESEIKIGSKKIQPKYLKLIQSLPGSLVAPDSTPKEQCIPFKFDGGEGLLMPLRD